ESLDVQALFLPVRPTHAPAQAEPLSHQELSLEHHDLLGTIAIAAKNLPLIRRCLNPHRSMRRPLMRRPLVRRPRIPRRMIWSVHSKRSSAEAAARRLTEEEMSP